MLPGFTLSVLNLAMFYRGLGYEGLVILLLIVCAYVLREHLMKVNSNANEECKLF